MLVVPSSPAADATETEAVPQTIFEDDGLRIAGLGGGTRTLFVAFTGIGHRLGALQREEFVRVAHAGGENSVLFVQDKTRSWYNEPSFAAKLEAIVAEWSPRCGRLVTIGNSMGGFGAIVFARLLRAQTAIAFAPQFSVCPEVIPQETRWREFTSRIAAFRYPSAAEHMTGDCAYYLFQGDGGKDWYQIGGFPIGPNVFQFVVPGGPHNLASVLKARGELSVIVDACADGDIGTLNAIMAGCGAVRRSPEDDPYDPKRASTRKRAEAPGEQARAAPEATIGPLSEEEARRHHRIHREQERREQKKATRLERKGGPRRSWKRRGLLLLGGLWRRARGFLGRPT